MSLVSLLGRRPKTTMHFCYGTFVSFRGGAGPQHAHTVFGAATLHDSLFWEAHGWHLRHKADKALGVTSMRPVGAITMPLAVQSYNMDNTAHSLLAKTQRRHQLFAQFHLQRESNTQSLNLRAAGGIHLRLLEFNKS